MFLSQSGKSLPHKEEHIFIIIIKYTVKFSSAVMQEKNRFVNTRPGANVIKLFTVVICCHSMVIPLFCVINLYYFGNYHGMAVNYHGIKLFYNIGQKVCFKCQT
jgi:hypothetical protein